MNTHKAVDNKFHSYNKTKSEHEFLLYSYYLNSFVYCIIKNKIFKDRENFENKMY